MSFAVTVGIIALLLYAAWRDIATRLIPDEVSIAIAVLGLAARAMDGVSALGISLLVASGLFLALAMLHRRGLLGGGDVKLLVALALGLPAAASLDVLLATILAGGPLGLVYLALSRLPLRRLLPAGPRASVPRRVLAVERWRIRRRGPLPYAAAIAVGGSLVVLQSAGG